MLYTLWDVGTSLSVDVTPSLGDFLTQFFSQLGFLIVKFS